MEVNEPRTTRRVQHGDTEYWVEAEPEGDPDFWEKDYWVASKDGTAMEEGLEVPWWYRTLTSLFMGYEWEKY